MTVLFLLLFTVKEAYKKMLASILDIAEEKCNNLLQSNIEAVNLEKEIYSALKKNYSLENALEIEKLITKYHNVTIREAYRLGMADVYKMHRNLISE